MQRIFHKYLLMNVTWYLAGLMKMNNDLIGISDFSLDDASDESIIDTY